MQALEDKVEDMTAAEVSQIMIMIIMIMIMITITITIIIIITLTIKIVIIIIISSFCNTRLINPLGSLGAVV